MIFAPIFLSLKMKWAVVLLVLITMLFWLIIVVGVFGNGKGEFFSFVSTVLFESNPTSVILFSLFFSLMSLNLISFMLYSYPVTTTLGFNLGAAVTCWAMGVLIQFMKMKPISSLLPSNTPWYLVPFLCLVELVSILVRPITLCFRLLANMVAGHVLLALIAKISYVWVIGGLFGMLELMVALVQAFVFSMLISVYLEEAFSH